MFDPKILDELSERISKALPPGLVELQQESNKHIRSALQTAFGKMDLVTREEFDIQRAVLERTRKKLEELEKLVAKLEQK